MTLAAPVWLSLLGLLPFVVLLHLRRERRAAVGSLLVWRRVLGGEAASRPRRSRLLRTLPLVLQVVAITTAALALAGPRFGHAAAGHQIYLLDTSATMLVDEGGGQRLEQAIGWLRREIGALDGATIVSIVTVAPKPEPVFVRGAASALGPTAALSQHGVTAAPDWPAAAHLALSLLSGGESVAVTLLTDAHGAATALEAALPLFGAERLRTVSFGGAVPNAGLAGVEVRRGVGDGGRVEVSGAVVAHLREGAPLHLLFEHREEGSTEFQPLTELSIDAGSGSPVGFAQTLELPGSGDLRLALAGADAYPYDDVVLIPLRAEREPRRLLLVGEIDAALVRVLELLEDVELFHAPAMPEQTSGFDLVVVDGVAADRQPDSATLWLGAAAPGAPAGATLVAPSTTRVRTDHRLGRVIDLAGLQASESLAVPRLQGATVLAWAGDTPLVQVRTTSAGRQAQFAFRLADSSLPDEVAFPAFVAELVDWLVARPLHGLPTVCEAGRPCPLPAAAFRGDWEVVGAQGQVVASSWGATATEGEPIDVVWQPGSVERAFVPRLAGTYRLATKEGSHWLVVTAQPWLTTMPPANDVPSRSESGAVEQASDGAPGSRLAPWRIAVFVMASVVLLDALVGRARLRARRRSRRVLAWACSAAAVALGLAALARVPLPSPPEGASRVVLVDRRPLSDAGEALPHLPKPDDRVLEVSLIGASLSRVVDGEAERRTTPGELRRDAATGTGTLRADHLGQALEVVRGLARGAATDHVTIMGGAGLRLDEGSLADQVRAFLAAGIAVDVLAGAAHKEEPLRFGQVFVPQRVRAGDTIVIRAVLESSMAREALVRVAVDDRVVLERRHDLAEGANVLEFPVRLTEPGPTHLELLASQEGATGAAASTSTRHILEVGPVPEALLISTDRNAIGAIEALLADEGVNVTFEPPLNLPWSLEGLSRFDVVLLSNVPALEIHTIQQEALERWVRKEGGGLLVLGGESSFGPGGYFRTALEELSPLSSQVPQDAPEVTMLFLLDRSGSMQQRVGDLTRMDVAKEAAIGSVGLLAPGSQVAVIAYDTEAVVAVPLQSVQNREQIETEIASLRANGGTALYPALLEAQRILAGVDSAAIHIVVLTDGMSQPGDFASVLADLRASGATISLVGIGEGADRVQLNDLARLAGGSLHMTNDVRALPSILAQEALMLADELTREGNAPVRFAGTAAPFLGPTPRFPPIEGYVETRAKPQAEVHAWVENDQGSPLLATWRYGLGRVLAFASHGSGAWTRDWPNSPEFAGLWDRAVRWAVASKLEPGLTLALEGEAMSVTVRALLATVDGAPRSGERLSARVTDSALTSATGTRGGSVPIRLEEVGPGTYVGRLDLAEAGATWVEVTVDGDPTVRAVAAVYVPEVVAGGGAPANRTTMTSIEALARFTGGSVLRGVDGWTATSSRMIWQPRFRPWVLAAIAALLFSLVARYGLPRTSDLWVHVSRLGQRGARRRQMS